MNVQLILSDSIAVTSKKLLIRLLLLMPRFKIQFLELGNKLHLKL